MAKKKRTTILDVAVRAGVSVATVSYVLNEKENQSISAETTDRIREAVRELNYVPNRTASALKNGKSRLIGVVFPQDQKDDSLILTNPAHALLFSQIENTARENDFQVLLYGIGPDQDLSTMVRKRNLDGMILIGDCKRDLPDDAGICPVVWVDPAAETGNWNTIGPDDMAGASLAVNYLIGKGHKKIAFVGGDTEKDLQMARRLEGYQAALKEAGIRNDKKMILEGPVSCSFGMQAVEKLKKGVTAVFAASDVLALGILRGLHSKGIQVPDQVSVVGFDDIPQAAYSIPSLTTVHHDLEEKGRNAMDLMLDMLEGHDRIRQISMNVSLIERESAAGLK